MKTTTEVATKQNAGGEAVTTNLTIDWEGMTEDDVRALAQQALIVKLQGGWRKNGIPNGDFTVLATEHKVGVRAPRGPVDPVKLVATLSDEQKAALLKMLQG